MEKTKEQYSGDEKELMLFGLDWDKAMLTNDVDEISKFMSDDWIIVGTEGGITSKETFLTFISSGDLKHSQMNSDETRIKLYGNTGITISRGTSAGTFKDQPFNYYEWSVSVFMHNGDTWKCVTTMLTKANE